MFVSVPHNPIGPFFVSQIHLTGHYCTARCLAFFLELSCLRSMRLCFHSSTYNYVLARFMSMQTALENDQWMYSAVAHIYSFFHCLYSVGDNRPFVRRLSHTRRVSRVNKLSKKSFRRTVKAPPYNTCFSRSVRPARYVLLCCCLYCAPSKCNFLFAKQLGVQCILYTPKVKSLSCLVERRSRPETRTKM